MDGMKMVLVGFVFILSGVIFISALADETTRVTQANTVTNESITIVNATAVSLANNQLDSFTELSNVTNGAVTEGDNYTVDLSAGTVTGVDLSGAYNASYVYREVGNSTSRTLTNLVIVFFAIGVMVAGAGFAIKGLREAGVL